MIRRTFSKIVSALIAVEMVFGLMFAGGPAFAAATTPGTPYKADGSYDVTVPHVFVNQVFGSGLSSATGTFVSNGFIELYNPTSGDVDLGGWSLQYADCAKPTDVCKTTGASGAWDKLDLQGTIKAHSSFLIKANPTGDTTYNLDLTNKGDQVWNRSIHSKGVKVVLMSNRTLLEESNKNPFATKPEGYVDMVGTVGNDAGSKIDGYETTSLTYTTGTSKKKAAIRLSLSDTDDTGKDFGIIDYDSASAQDRAAKGPRDGNDGVWGVEPLGLTNASLPTGLVGSPYAVTLAAYGGVKPYTFTATGLPSGLTLNAATGVISGTPAPDAQGTASVSLTVQDNAQPAASVSTILSLVIAPAAVTGAERAALLKQSIQANNTNFNDPVMKAGKYVLQAASGFNFYRGNPNLFFNDLDALIAVPDAWKQWDLNTWIQGDAHLQNVGTFENVGGEAQFSLNDFDASYAGPFYLDLLRMVPSIYLERDQGASAAERNLSDGDIAGIAADFLDEYRDTLLDIRNSVIDTTYTLTSDHLDGFTKTMLDKMATTTRKQQLDKAAPVGGNGQRAFKSDAKYVVMTETEKNAFLASWQEYLNSIQSFAADKTAENPDYFKVKDVVYRVNQGNASIGSIRYNAVIEGASSGPDDDILMDIKQEAMPVYLQSLGMDLTDYVKQFGDNHGKRATEAYRKLTQNPDPFAGWMQLGGNSFVVRPIAVSKGDYTDMSGAFASGNDLDNYLKYSAQALALGHARATAGFAGSFAAALADDAAWSAFKLTLMNAAETYYRQVVADYGSVKSDMNGGALLDVKHLQALTVSGGTLSPAFGAFDARGAYGDTAPARSYSVSVAEGASSITVQAAAADSLAGVDVAGTSGTGTASKTIEVVAGMSPVEVKVTARDGSTMTYSLAVKLPAEPESPTYTIGELSNLTMKPLTIGYAAAAQETKKVTLTRTGTGDLTNLAAQLSGTNAGSFTVAQPALTTLDNTAAATTFSVQAKDGLIAGTYTATVTVTADKMTPVTFTVTQVVNVAESSTGPAMTDKIVVEKLGSFIADSPNDDGGVAEIVKYNKDNGRFYLVDGAGNPPTLKIVALGDGTSPKLVETVRVNELAEKDGFVYGDLTSVDINTTAKRVAISVQEKDPMKAGKILVLDYDGKLIREYEAGVQPDMIKSTADGRYILTADEGEPRTKGLDPEGSVTIVDTSTNTVKHAKFDDPTVIGDGVQIRGAGDATTGQITSSGSKADAVRDLEPEYIALSIDEKTAYVSLQENNAVAAIDVASGKVLWVKGLGLKDLNDPSNKLDLVKDGRIQLENVPFYGVYMPDGIASFRVGNKTYLVTGNEGDATEWDGRINSSSVKKMKSSLTPGSAAAEFIKNTTRYDSVEVMSDMGTDSLYMYGGRSISIRDADTLGLVWDSGSDFERVTAQRLPEHFNASHSSSKAGVDERSAKKGPEPEDVKTGVVGTHTLAFAGFERIGGVITYDVTKPESPQFLNYVNTRDFSAGKGENVDSGPEGLEFIQASDSPTGYPLLLVANEVGGTVSVLQLKVSKVSLDRSSLSLTAGGSAGKLAATAVGPDGQTVAVTWSSSNPGIATVSADGAVAPLNAGSATVTATTADGYAIAQAAVTVVTGGGPSASTPTPSATPSPTPSATPTPTAAPGTEVEQFGDVTLETTGSKAVLKATTTTGTDGSAKAELAIPSTALAKIADGSVRSLTVDTGTGSLTLDAAAIKALSAAAGGGEVKLAIERLDGTSVAAKLPAAQQQAVKDAIGDRPVFDLTVTTASGKLSAFGGGKLKIEVPYTIKAGETAEALIVHYIAEDGHIETLPGGVYDAASGTLSFSTPHLSMYGIGYSLKTFGDAQNSFAKTAIGYLAARGIIAGVGSDSFAPKRSVTRGDLALMLARMAGVDLSKYNAAGAGFGDVRSADYFGSAVAWAASENIVAGTAAGKFEPRAEVTRDQLAVMLVKYAAAMNYTLPSQQEAVAFADAKAIPAYAANAVSVVQRAGIVGGKPRGDGAVYYAPKDKATREEIAKMLAGLMQRMEG
ncbi:choice-of-anchor I family protein [Cohnella hashimotonis]|uniref:Choice-of-anchor I family protein n=1 Tax=Cohnella hashimotonis TaxID=2826895 RepID=A0ABT6TBG5_9BACL|nr:choice-of-anchor I family protein [Cohnella hashimotonis]MDI4644177.1 choice-of-anchor I family protein [Cohnella hashimotonis]